MGNVVSFDGFDLRQTGVNAFIVGWGGDPTRSNSFAERVQSTPVFSGSRYDTRQFTIAVEFNISEPTLTQTRRKVVGWFMDKAHYDRERVLVIEDNGAKYFRNCVAIKTLDQHRSIVQFEMESAEPTWKAMVPTISSTYDLIATTQSQRITNNSAISVNPLITIAVGEGFVGQYQRYRRSYYIANRTNSAMKNEPIMLNLGDTRPWVSAGKAMSFGQDIEAIIDGKVIRTKLVNFNSGETHIWILMPFLESGGSTVVDILYGAGQPRELPMSAFTHPAFGIAGSYGTSNAGSTTTSIIVPLTTVNRAKYLANQLIGGYMKFLTGQNAGLVRDISANTARSDVGTSTITVSTPFTYTPAAGDEWVAYLSDNYRWNYMVRREDRGTATSSNQYYNTWGGWYLQNPGSKGPSDVRFGDVVPASWNRFLYQNNGDDKSQTSNKLVGSFRFSILDASRRRASDRTLKEEGAFDGVILSTAVPMSSIICDYKFKNPASTSTYGQANAKILYQIYGGDEWSVAHENSQVYANETTIAAATYSFSPDRATQVAFTLVGMNVVKDEAGVIVSKEGEISNINTSTAQSTFSWGDVLRITRYFDDYVFIFDPNTSLVTTIQQASAAVETSIKEFGARITVNGGTMLNQSLPSLSLPASYGTISRGDYQRIYVGPKTRDTFEKSTKTIAYKETDNAIVLDTARRKASIFKKTGYIGVNLRLVSELKSIPWAVTPVSGVGTDEYTEVESVNSEWLLIPPTTGFRPSGYPSFSSTYWGMDTFSTPVTFSEVTFTGKQAAKFSFTPASAGNIFNFYTKEVFNVTPGQTFRWSAMMHHGGQIANHYAFLAVGWSNTATTNTSSGFPYDPTNVTQIYEAIATWTLFQWQGVVPSGMNFAKLYIVYMYYGATASTLAEHYISDVMIMDNVIHTYGTRDSASLTIETRDEFL